MNTTKVIKEAHIFYNIPDEQVLEITTFAKGNMLGTRRSRAPRREVTADTARTMMRESGWTYKTTVSSYITDDGTAPYMIFTKG